MKSSFFRNSMNSLIAKTRVKIRWYLLLSTIIFLSSILYSFFSIKTYKDEPPSEMVKFSIMLWNKKDIIKFIPKNLDYLVFQLTNSGYKNRERRTFELVVYAYDKSGRITFEKLKSPSTIGSHRLGDSSFNKEDNKIGNFVMCSKDFLYITSIAPSYKYLRFDPFENTKDPIFKDYVSYNVEPVDSNGIGIEVKDTATLEKKIPTKTLDPSPPAH